MYPNIPAELKTVPCTVGSECYVHLVDVDVETKVFICLYLVMNLEQDRKDEEQDKNFDQDCELVGERFQICKCFHYL